MANIRTLTLTVFHVIFVDSCVHDQQQFLKPVRGHQQYMERRASGYMPIRIVFDTRYIDNPSVAPATQQYIHSLLSYAQNRFRDVLSVQPVVGNLFVSRNCSLYWLQGSVLGNCSVASDINQCGQVREIPAEHLGGLLVVPATGVLNYIAPGTGIPNADLIVYVTLSAGNICGGSTLAYASACQVDQNDRPIVGNINFCPFNATRSADPFQRLHDQETALHELIHVLGFSSPLFALFRDASGSPRTPRCPSAPGCTDADAPGDPPFNASSGSFVVSPSTVLASTRRGAPIRFVATPSVRAVARDYFGCATVAGGELEQSILTMTVQDVLVPSVVGRGGSIIQSIQAHTGTRIQLSPRGEFVVGTRDLRLVTITGPTYQQANAAFMMLSDRGCMPYNGRHGPM